MRAIVSLPAGVKLGFMSPFLKAAALTLADIPAVNAVIDGSDVSYGTWEAEHGTPWVMPSSPLNSML